MSNKLWEVHKDVLWLKKKLIGNGQRGVFGDITEIKTEIQNFKKNYVSYRQLIGYFLASVGLLALLIGGVNYLTLRLF